MKILIVSDTHGKHENLRKIIWNVSPIDMLIHCGDTEGGEDRIAEMAGCPCEIVAGNNDFFSQLPAECDFMLGRYKVWLLHGHNFYVSMGPEHLIEEARARGVDIVMYGHTHRPSVELTDGLYVVNPGSVSYPRQDGRKPSYIIMELDSEGEAHFTINYL